METLNREFLAWFARFWEGEGWFSTRHQAGSKRPRTEVGIKQVDKRPLSLIQSKLGGRLELERVRGKPNWKPIWRWSVAKREDALKTVRLLIPYLRFRKNEVERKIEYVKSVVPRNPSSKWVTTSHFTDEEDEYIKNHWRDFDYDIARRLRRSVGAIAERRGKLGFFKPTHRQKKWDWEQIKRNYLLGMSTPNLQKKYGIPTKTAENALKRMGIMRNHKKAALLQRALNDISRVATFTIDEKGERIAWKV